MLSISGVVPFAMLCIVLIAGIVARIAGREYFIVFSFLVWIALHIRPKRDLICTELLDRGFSS